MSLVVLPRYVCFLQGDVARNYNASALDSQCPLPFDFVGFFVLLGVELFRLEGIRDREGGRLGGFEKPRGGGVNLWRWNDEYL